MNGWALYRVTKEKKVFSFEFQTRENKVCEVICLRRRAAGVPSDCLPLFKMAEKNPKGKEADGKDSVFEQSIHVAKGL